MCPNFLLTGVGLGAQSSLKPSLFERNSRRTVMERKFEKIQLEAESGGHDDEIRP
jgi:hypothetical protein